MTRRYKAESDGGGWWQSGRRIEQPRTHYVVDTEEGERIDCETAAEARNMAERLNRELQNKEHAS